MEVVTVIQHFDQLIEAMHSLLDHDKDLTPQQWSKVLDLADRMNLISIVREF